METCVITNNTGSVINLDLQTTTNNGALAPAESYDVLLTNTMGDIATSPILKALDAAGDITITTLGLNPITVGSAASEIALSFKNIAQRDSYFSSGEKSKLLETDLTVITNQGNAVTTFVWTGADNPATYDATLFMEQALNSGPGTLFLGIDGTSLSSAAKVINFNSAYGDKALGIANFFNQKGSSRALQFDFEKEFVFTVADVFDTQLSQPQEFAFVGPIGPTYTEGLLIRPATSGTLRFKGYAGLLNTDPIIVDTIFEISPGDIGNIIPLPFPNGLESTEVDEQLLVLEGIDLFGGLQTSGQFNGQTKPFLQATIHIQEANFLLNRKDMDQYLSLNRDHTNPVLKTGGMIVATLPTTTTDTFTNATFVAGVAATSNPTIQTDGSNTFSPNDIILLKHGTDILDSDLNDGFYEVASHVGNILTPKGIGTIPLTEDSLEDQFSFIESTGTITKVEVSVLKLSGSQVLHGGGSTTPITFHVLAHSSDVPIVATESFASTDARFFGELALPATQGWTDTINLTGTIAIFADTVFGTQQDVIKYDIPLSSDSAKSELALSGANWDNILTFGASYSGVCRITKDISTQSIFSGMGFSPANDPRPSSIESRVGVFISVNATHTTIRLDGQSTITLDGLSGRPLVLKDKYFSWEIIIDPTPDAGVNFGSAEMFVDGISIIVGGIVASNDAVSDEVSVANSSSTGATTFYFASFGVTIYEEVSTRVLATATMAANIVQVFVPSGQRDYIVILPNGAPRGLGDKLEFVLKNVNGKIKIRTEDLALPQVLLNGLREIDKNIATISELSFINTVEGGSIYVEGSNVLNQDSLGFEPGSINYDPIKGTMNVRNIFPGSSVQVGQESVVFVVNNSGATITDGKVVNISGYDSANDAMEIGLAIADTVDNTEVLGLSTTTMIDGSVGLVTVFGRVNDLDTSSFTEGEDVFLSDTVAGELITSRPSIPIQMGHVGKVDASIGFIQVEIKEMEKSIFGGFSHSSDQTFTANISTPIQFNKNEKVLGIDHSESVDNDEFTFPSGGSYQATAEPQYTRTSGGGTDVLNMFIARDTGSGFVNVADSNVKLSVNTAGNTTVSPLTATFTVAPGDKIRFMVQVESANLILDAFPASGTAPNDIPLTPSIIMNIVRIGD